MTVRVNPNGIRTGCFAWTEYKNILVSDVAVLDSIKNKENEGWKVDQACFDRASGVIRAVILLEKAGSNMIAAWNSAKSLPPIYSEEIKGKIMFWGNGDDMSIVEDAKDPYGFRVDVRSGFAEGLEAWNDYFTYTPGTKVIKKIKSCYETTDLGTNKTTETCK